MPHLKACVECVFYERVYTLVNTRRLRERVSSAAHAICDFPLREVVGRVKKRHFSHLSRLSFQIFNSGDLACHMNQIRRAFASADRDGKQRVDAVSDNRALWRAI